MSALIVLLTGSSGLELIPEATVKDVGKGPDKVEMLEGRELGLAAVDAVSVVPIEERELGLAAVPVVPILAVVLSLQILVLAQVPIALHTSTVHGLPSSQFTAVKTQPAVTHGNTKEWVTSVSSADVCVIAARESRVVTGLRVRRTKHTSINAGVTGAGIAVIANSAGGRWSRRCRAQIWGAVLTRACCGDSGRQRR